MFKKTLFSAALIAALTVPLQSEARAQLSGTYTVSGSSGSWFMNFTITNLYSASTNLYGIGFVAPNLIATGAPAGFGTPDCFGANFTWDISDCSAPAGVLAGLAPGATLGGFQATYTGASMPNLNFQVKSYLLACTPTDCSIDDDMVYDDFRAKRVDVPEPGSMMLIASGLLGLVGVRRRRQDQGEDI